MITRPNFGLNYQGYDAAKPPPVGYVTERHNAAPSSHLHRAGAPAFGPSTPRVMMDPLDPSTWQRPYIFTT
jgi:hypothetical protein